MKKIILSSDFRLFGAGADDVFQPDSELTPGRASSFAADAIETGVGRTLFRSWEYR